MSRSSLPKLCLLLVTTLFAGVPASAWSPWHSTNMVDDKSVLVQLFEWRFDDIAYECENFLGPKGYGGVQVSPVNEYAVIVHNEISPDAIRPWWERYQVVSYKIVSRSGNEAQMLDMIKRCNAVGVRVYIDVILNHMTGPLGKGKGIGGTPYDTQNLDYPGVPFNSTHFNKKTKCGTNTGGIENFNDRFQSRNCALVGLNDLDQSQQYVRDKMSEFLNYLLRTGIAGFRVDATKHIWPEDMKLIMDNMIDVDAKIYGEGRKAFAYHEVVYMDEGEVTTQEYTGLGRVIDFRYMDKLSQVFRKVNNYTLKVLHNYGADWGFLAPEDAIVLVDNHDVQRDHTLDSRVAMSFRRPREMKMSTAFMLAWPYGLPKVMSSFDWEPKRDKVRFCLH